MMNKEVFIVSKRGSSKRKLYFLSKVIKNITSRGPVFRNKSKWTFTKINKGKNFL